MKVLDTFGIDDVFLLNPQNKTLFEKGTLDFRVSENARSGNMWPSLGFTGLIFVFAVLLPAVGLGYDIWQDTAINRDGVAIEAQVNECTLVDQGGARVEFSYMAVDAAGLPRTYTASEIDGSISNCADLATGSAITVRILEDDPAEVRWQSNTNWTQALCVIGVAVFFGVPFLIFRAISTVRAFNRGNCLDRIEGQGYLKLGEVIESRWKTPTQLEITYHVTTHENNHITGIDAVVQPDDRLKMKPPRRGTRVVVAYFDGDCYRLL